MKVYFYDLNYYGIFLFVILKNYVFLFLEGCFFFDKGFIWFDELWDIFFCEFLNLYIIWFIKLNCKICEEMKRLNKKWFYELINKWRFMK